MGTMNSQLREELINLLESNYESERILSDTVQKASGLGLKEYLQECALFYRKLGDHLLLALALEGIKTDTGSNRVKRSGWTWMDSGSLCLAATDHELLKIVLHGHDKALLHMETVLVKKALSYDLAMVIEKGAMILKGIREHVQSLADLSKSRDART